MLQAIASKTTEDQTAADAGVGIQADIRVEGIRAEAMVGTERRAERAMRSGRRCTNC
jgi:hypothetical protein